MMAERAVRAGVEVNQAVRALKSRAPLQTRVGIATGLGVVGDLIGAGEAQERGIVGETPNLAARFHHTTAALQRTRWRSRGHSDWTITRSPVAKVRGVAGPARQNGI